MMKPPSAARPLSAASAPAVSSSRGARRQPEIEADDQKQHREARDQLQKHRHAPHQRRTAEQKLVGQAQHHADIGEQRVEIDAGDIAEIFDEHRAGAQLGARQPFALTPRDDVGLRLHRHQQHDVVVDQNLRGALAQAPPFGGLERLHVVAAPEEPHLAVIVERCLDLDPHGGSPRMRLARSRRATSRRNWRPPAPWRTKPAGPHRRARVPPGRSRHAARSRD